VIVAVVASGAAACGRAHFDLIDGDDGADGAGDGAFVGVDAPGASPDPMGDAPATQKSGLVLNEVMAGGTEVGNDPPNVQYDWVELANLGSTAVDVSGWHLSDNAASPTKGTFPSGSIVPAGGRLLVRMREGGNPAFDFGLPNDGSQPVILTPPSGSPVVDQTMFPDGSAGPGGSWSREPDGTGAFRTTNVATPNLTNA
jgi:hypothetical protein